MKYIYIPIPATASLTRKRNLELEIRTLHPVLGPAQVRRRSLEQALPDVGLAQQQLNVLLGPVARRQRLQEHHDLLEVHLYELVGPFHEEGGADVEVEFGEALFFGLGLVSCC